MSPDAWTLSTHEFRLLWEEHAGGAPYPQTFAYGSSSETFPDADARRLAEQQIRARLQQAWTPMKAEAFDAFNRPELSIDIVGAHLRDGKIEHFRAHGAYRGRPSSAFVAVQASTVDITEGGQVAITGHELNHWASSLVDTFPRSMGAGRLPTDTAVPVTSQPVMETTIPTVDVSASTETAAAPFAHLTPTMGAVLTLRAGSIADGVQPTSLYIHVVDIADDGRYALLMDSPATAVGVDETSLARLINKAFNALRTRHSRKTA